MEELLPAFPLSTVLFPHAVLPLQVFEPRYRVMTKECLDGDGLFGVVLISRGSEVGGGEERVSVGTAGRIEQASMLPDGRSLLLVRGTTRFRVAEWLADDPYPRGMVQWLSDPAEDDDVSSLLADATTAVRRARALLSELQDVPALSTTTTSDTAEQSWWLCDQAPLATLDRQHLLESEDLEGRLRLLTELCEATSDDLSRLLASG